MINELRLPAIEIKQGRDQAIYSCAIDGKRIHDIATVSRVRRSDESELKGYQRPEVSNHIEEIRAYVESDAPLIPNSLVVAFDGRVRFEALPDTDASGTRHGWLVIPVDDEQEDHEKPGWIVDGQQRAAAIRDARIKQFPVAMTAFITDDASLQREQFILVNSTKPLPRSLIYELLPSTSTKLPAKFMKKRFPAMLLERLNFDEASPLNGRISTPTSPDGYIKDNSILSMLDNSLTDGVLYYYRDPDTGEGDMEAMMKVLAAFWGAVSDVFPTAWDLKPRKSRLTHGAGIKAMGFVMDAIADRYRLEENVEFPSRGQFEADLRPLAGICNWTSGYWDFAPDDRRKWNELQNLSKDINALANYLLVHYHELVWDADEERLGS